MKEKELLEKILKLGRIVLVVLIAILIVLILGVSKMYTSNTSGTNTENIEESEYNTEYDVSMFEEIEAKNIKNKTKDKIQVIYVGRETCGWCAAFLPTLWEAQDNYNFKTLYIDIAKIINFEDGSIIDQEAYDTMINIKGEGYEGYVNENFGATPMVLIIKDNKIIGAQTGYSEYAAFETILNDAGITK